MTGKSFLNARKRILNVLIDNGSIPVGSPELMRSTYETNNCSMRKRDCNALLLQICEIDAQDRISAFGVDYRFPWSARNFRSQIFFVPRLNQPQMFFVPRLNQP
jgi:hypothetical protein